MEISSDPYEQKLFLMFQSCDSDRSGLLDESELRRLCEMLELRDNGATLIDDLAEQRKNDAANAKSRVSFGIFKEALLNFLGTELDGTTTMTTVTSPTSRAVGSGGIAVGDKGGKLNNTLGSFDFIDLFRLYTLKKKYISSKTHKHIKTTTKTTTTTSKNCFTTK